MTKTWVRYILAICVLLVLWWQARQSIWNSHLQVDVWVSWQRIEYWLGHNHSFAGMLGNEILPMTLLYVLLPMRMIPVNLVSYANYLPVAMLINLIVVGLHLPLIKRKTIFLISLLCFGPILLFRFDGMVTLVMLLSLIAFVKQKYPQSGFWLGLATGMKVFPIILLPYLVMILLRQKQLKQLLRWLICFGEALLIPVIIYLFMGGNLEQVGAALSFHGQKLISIESIPGSLITGWSLIVNGVPPAMIPGNGIWAVAGPAELFNRLWVLPVAVTYYWVWRSRSLVNTFKWIVPLGLMMIFLIFSKNLNPQYLWWFMIFLPMVKLNRSEWGVILAVALLNQLVFPIFYTTLTDNFFLQNRDYWIYYLLMLRNIGLMVITYLITQRLWFNSSKADD
ncbi:MAG: hypothetical protein V1487_03675 [bacterium]